MKIFEGVVDGRIRDIVQLSSNQCGFVAGCGTIHAARLLIEEHREKQRPVHIDHLDLEKAFDRVSREVMERFGLKLNVKKTEYLTTDVTESSSIKVSGIELPRTAVFKFLGLAVASDGKLMVEVNSRMSAAWSKWRSLTGVLCDEKMPERLKSKIYKTVVRPVAMYSAECWPATKEVETRLSVMETKMLRWTAEVTRMDRIRNDVIRQKFGVAPIADKMREARLQCTATFCMGRKTASAR
ncbi:unnamed protein product [Heligmosomoides polygyrus]|uniref:Reverse transcriptase domain-containing protein n=1 Tax=Heligmosomoides polygyrus TaxID=6339 RepID=A0A183FU09_HELPZ|nr:unnamed protein product [Heligmosomoides polygyrus]